MAYSSVAPGVGYKDPNDVNDPTFTPADSEFVATTVAARLMELGASLGAMQRLVESLAALTGTTAQTPVDGQTAALISQADTLTHQALLAVLGEHSLTLAVQAEAEGVVGDGVTDDTDALHAAAAKAVSLGVPLVLRPGMSVGISYYKRLPEGLTLYTGGADFQQIVAMGRAPVVGLGPRSRVVGGLRVWTMSGDACQGVHIADAPDVVIDSVDVRAYTPGAGKGNVRDNGLRVLNSDRLTVGRVFVENYDWGVWIEASDGAQIGSLEVRTYSLAVRLRDPRQVNIGSGRTYGASPNSAYLPGYNGILIEAMSADATDGVQIENFLVEGAGEHGYRIGGLYSARNITFTRCTARNVGGSGFKTLAGEDTVAGNATRIRGVIMDHCTVEDAGEINRNCCGFLIQRADDVRIVAPVVRKKGKTYSAVEGIRMSGVTNVTVASPRVWDTRKYGIHLDEAYGNISDATFTDLHVSASTGHGVYLQNPGVEFRDLRFEGYIECTSTDGQGFYAGRYTSKDTGTWRGVNRLEVTFSESTLAENQVSSASSPTGLGSFVATITGRRYWQVPFRPGSLWHDMRSGTRQVLQSTTGTWESIIPKP